MLNDEGLQIHMSEQLVYVLNNVNERKLSLLPGCKLELD